jgi:D-alanyl-D-alanine carboxypeptidase/D-alanyl-D-alanine-endopeptidase (penicillin-binding protein 4)
MPRRHGPARLPAPIATAAQCVLALSAWATPTVAQEQEAADVVLPAPGAPALDAPATDDVAALRYRLQGALDGYHWGNAAWGVLVVSLDTQDTIFAVEPEAALAPASKLKLLTTAAALHVLGPEYRFRTYVLADGPVSDGVLDGDLVLYGTGDPGISDRFYGSKEEVFHRLIDQLELEGIHTVTGDVVADASFFPGPLRHEGWEREDLNEHFTAAVSALSYNENVVSFRIRPGAPGEAPLAETVPPHSALEVVNSAETVTDRARPRLAILRDDPLEPVRIEGRMTVGSRDVWRQMTVAVPADFAGASFRAVLEERGIRVAGETRSVSLPAASAVRRLSAPALGVRGPRILASHASRPLADYLAVINKESNNLFAELVFRATGRVARGAGTPEASALAVRDAMAAIDLDTVGLEQHDGSGLSSANRVSARSFVDVIARMSDGPLWPEYWATLPRAGTRRELGRMYRTAAADNLRAKTGTIEGVSALSGLVRSQDGERLAFSIIVNETPSETRAKRVENQIGTRLAEFRRSSGAVPTVAPETPPPSRTLTAFTARHRIAQGENLSSIAYRYGVTVQEILRINPRVSPNRIVAGQWLEIPQRGGGY